MSEEKIFTWIPFYEEFSQKLVEYKDQVDENGYHLTLVEKIKSLDSEWTDFIRARAVNGDFADIDPFTIFAIFNRSSGNEKRISILRRIKDLFELSTDVPKDFDGIPLVMSTKSCFYVEDEKKETIPLLWNLFISFMENNTEKIKEYFSLAEKQKGIRWNLTMAFFWMKPDEYMPLDSRSQALLKKHEVSVFSPNKLTGENYLKLNVEVKEKIKEKFYVFSKNAYDSSQKNEVNGLMVQDSESWMDQLIEEMGSEKKGVFWWHKNPVGKTETISELRRKLEQVGSFDVYLFRDMQAIYRATVFDFACSSQEYEEKKNQWQTENTIWLEEKFDQFREDEKKRQAKILFLVGEMEKLDDFIPMDNFIPSKNYSSPRRDNLVPFKTIKEKKVVAPMENNMKELLLTKKNIILQGAPGTGKTYNTAELALSICDGVAPSNHKDIMTRYDELVKQRRIGFVTFHQSMDYEDFVEGIKPKTTENGITYEIEDGIFKTMCKNAEKIENKQINSGEIDFSKTRIFKMSLGEKGRNDVEIFDFCFKNNVIALGWGDDKDFSKCKERADFRKMDSTWGAFAVEIFKEWMKNGDIVLIADGTKAVRAIAQIEGDYEYHNDYSIDMCQYRKVKWLYTGESIPISKIYDKNLSQQTIYAFGSRDKDGNVENGSIKLDVLNDIITGDVEKAPIQNYVLIIDEINRGNVSKIFGELITLLEADKRSDANHPIPVILPYTKVPFSVPSNLYIIGTMNTTDRSVGSIDYAVRRRFAFVTLKADESKAPEGDARELFKAVRRFLKESKYDMDIEDLMVGHSYFMDTANLQMKWQYEILPLLMEYHKDGIINQSPLNGFSEKQVKEVKVDYKLFIEKWPEKKSEEAEK